MTASAFSSGPKCPESSSTPITSSDQLRQKLQLLAEKQNQAAFDEKVKKLQKAVVASFKCG